jgi:hypothetical protein
MIAPMIAASVLAPEAAAVPLSAGFASLFGLQQMHETQESMKKAGLEPGIAPLATGGATALAMIAAPTLIGRFLTKPIESLITKEVAQQTVGSLVKPTALDLIKKASLAGLATEGIFLAQTGAVSGVEKSYGLPHDIPSELWETAKGAAAMSLVGGAVGYPVRKLLDNVHVANLSKPVDTTNVPEDQQKAYLDTHSKVRSNYAEVVGRMLDHGDRKDLGDAWRAYADDKIRNNEPIDMNMTLDQVSLAAETLQGKVARDMGLDKELNPQVVTNNETELAKDETPESVPETKPVEEDLGPLQGLADLSELKLPETSPEPEKVEAPAPEEKVAPEPKAEEKTIELTPEQKAIAEEAKETIFKFQKAKTGKKAIASKIAEYQAENPNLTTEDMVARFLKEGEVKAQQGRIAKEDAKKEVTDGTMPADKQIDLAKNIDVEEKRITDEGKDVAAGCEERGKLKIGK